MKTMTCKPLGGACEEKFSAESFEEMTEMSKAHGMEMYQKQDAAHIEAMAQMQDLMQSPADMQAWFEEKRKVFDALPSE